MSAGKLFLRFPADTGRMRRRLPLTLYALVITLRAVSAAAAVLAPSDSPALECRRSIRGAERGAGIPDHLLAAIAHVESGRRDPQTGEVQPWPWSINAEGQGFVYDSKLAAITAVRALQARGVRSIDVGCLQVNLNQHPDAFATLEQAFDPQANADYAARFLSQLNDRTGAWPKAAAAYHSATPELGAAYQALVLAAWPGEKSAQLAALGPDGAVAASPATGPAMAGGRVAVFLPPNRTDAMRIIPLGGANGPGDAVSTGGRSLDSYRAMPVALAARPPVRAGG